MHTFKNIIQYFRQCNILLHSIFLILCSGTATTLFSAWNRIGLAGVDVTAITTGVDIFHQQQKTIFAGTEIGEIFSIFGEYDSIKRYPNPNLGASDKPVGAVRALFVSNNGVETFAGTDSGLYGQSMMFSSLPAWKKIAQFASEPVIAIANRDTTYCIATATELYRAKSPFGTWTACSVSKWLPEPSRLPHFTSLITWWNAPFLAGSYIPAGTDGFGGVLTGSSNAHSWTNSTCIINQCVDSNVFSLTSDYSGKLYAGTSRGIFCASDFDTGQWFPLSPQLNAAPVHHICVTFDSSINAREIFASTDSGIYILSPRLNPNKWVNTTSLKSYGIVSLNPGNSKAVYAGTRTGLWKYMPDSGTNVRRKTPHPVFPQKVMTVRYTIDGRRFFPGGNCNNRTGVLINVQYDERGIHRTSTINLKK